MGGEPVDHVGDGTKASTDGGALEDEGCSGAIGSGVVGVGDTTGGEASEDGGVVELPVVVVSLADDGIGDGEEDARMDAAGAFIEVAGILLEEDGKDGVSEYVSGEEGAVGSGIALTVPLGSVSPGIGVVGLLDSSGSPDEHKAHGVDQGLERELELLSGVERDGVWDVADIKIGEDAEDALFFFFANLGLSDVGLRGSDLNAGVETGTQRDGGEVAAFARGEYAGGLLGHKSLGRDGEIEGAGRGAGEDKLSVAR